MHRQWTHVGFTAQVELPRLRCSEVPNIPTRWDLLSARFVWDPAQTTNVGIWTDPTACGGWGVSSEKWSLSCQAFRLLVVSSPETGRFHFYCLRLCGIFSDLFWEPVWQDYHPFLPWGRIPTQRASRVGISQQCWTGFGGREARGHRGLTHLLKLTCLLKENSGNLKARFQNFLRIPVKETCYLTSNSHLSKAHHFFEFFVFFSVKWGLCTLVISHVLWFCGQSGFGVISPSLKRFIWLIYGLWWWHAEFDCQTGSF